MSLVRKFVPVACRDIIHIASTTSRLRRLGFWLVLLAGAVASSFGFFGFFRHYILKLRP